MSVQPDNPGTSLKMGIVNGSGERFHLTSGLKRTYHNRGTQMARNKTLTKIRER